MVLRKACLLAGVALLSAMSVPGVLADCSAQEEVKPAGTPAASSWDPQGKWVSDDIIVKFARGTISLPRGSAKASLAELAPDHPGVAPALHAVGVSELRKVYPRFTEADSIRTLRSGHTVGIPDFSQVFVLSLRTGTDLRAAVETLRGSPRVIYAEPNYIFHEDATPNDEYFGQQWALEQPSDEDIDATAAWDVETGDYSIKLAILDSGIDYDHDDLGNAFGTGWKVSGGWDYVNNDWNPMDDRDHGTHVAGIAAALTKNPKWLMPNPDKERRLLGSIGIAGVAGGWGYNRRTNSGNKGAQLIALKVIDSSGEVDYDGACEAIVDAADPQGYGAHILSNSWGGLQGASWWPPWAGWPPTGMRADVHFAALMGCVFVASKGNQGTSQNHYPSDYDENWVISVGATNDLGSRWGNSNYGNGIDVVAPGVDIISTLPGNDHGYKTGTSMAAPHVAGLAALIFSQEGWLHPEDVQGIIRRSADDKGPPGYDDEYGAGRINAGRAMEYMEPPWALTHCYVYGGQVATYTPDPYPVRFAGPGPLDPNGSYLVKRYDVREYVSLPMAYGSTPYVWGRGVNETTGYANRTVIYQSGFCDIEPALWPNPRQVRTYVYEVWQVFGQNAIYKGWHPCAPGNVTFAYTVLGIPAAARPGGGGDVAAGRAPGTSGLPTCYALDQNRPNPFGTQTEIRFQLPEASQVSLIVYDARGREVDRLIDRCLDTGYHSVTWAPADIPGGTYVYRLSASGFTQSKRAVLLRE